MGIQGLLPFVEKSARKVNISEFAGCTVAIDSYCWLHKGAFSCAEKLARGEDTDQYVTYCMKYVNMLLSHNIKPILVFDGQHLPAKADTEKVRREKRESNRRRAAELLRSDRPEEAKVLIRRCVDVTHEMALALIKQCRARNVDCIVAPYEADAQLAYMNSSGIAHIIITEDSDLLLFGCKMVMFKMDLQGMGVLVEQSMLPLAMKQRPEQFSMDKFRHMCILAGCDYLPSLPGIGLAKACKFVKRTSDTDISRALTRLAGHLNMPSLEVTQEYREKFLAAEAMFRHQPVFDPLQRKIVPLTPLAPGLSQPLVCPLPPEKALQLAYGNLDPFSLKTVDTWNPDAPQGLIQTGKSWKVSRASHKSMWDKEFSLPKPLPPKKDPRNIVRPTTHGKQCVQPVETLTSSMQTITKRMSTEEQLESFRSMYGVKSPPTKKVCTQLEEFDALEEDEELLIVAESPIAEGKRNLFRTGPKSPVKFGHGGLSKLAKRTILDENNIVQSRYFGGPVEKVMKSPTREKSSGKGNISLDESMLRDVGNLLTTPQHEEQNSLSRPEGTSSAKSVMESSPPTSTAAIVVGLNGTPPISPVTPPPEDMEGLQGAISLDETLPPESLSPDITSSARRNIFALGAKTEDPSFEVQFSNSSVMKTSFLSLIDTMSGITSERKASSFKWSKTSPSVISKKLNTSSSFEKGDGEKEEACLLTPPLSQEPKKTATKPLQVKKISPKQKKSLIQPAKRVGLNKKKPTTPNNQPSLLTMFAFQPKVKLSLKE